MILRPYQRELIDKIKAEFKQGRKSVIAILGCGGGKSVIQADFARSTTDRGNRVLFLVHRRELVEQISNTFRMYGVDMSLCDVCMVQTASRRSNRLQVSKLIITDEAHHSTANSYMRIYEAFPKAIRIGFTATPWRLGGGGLSSVYEAMVEGVSTQWLIENHYLSPYKYYSLKLVDTDKLHKRAGEYIASEISELMEHNAIYGEVLHNYFKFADGKRTIIYCASVKASKETVEKFTDAGINAYHLDGETPSAVRSEVIQKFRNGEISVLSNVDLFGEGFDVPDCECVILLRPTLSLTLHIQQSMRSMRYKEGKTAIIIDHVGNVFRHGLPDDIREWKLEGRDKKKNTKSEMFVKTCPNCFLTLKQGLSECPYCGAVLKADEREIAQREAELAEIKREELRTCEYTEYKNIKTFDEMRLFQKARGYKFMWTIRKCVELSIPVPERYRYQMRYIR